MSIIFGPNLGLMVGGAQGDVHYTQFTAYLRGMDFFGQPIVKQVGLNTPAGSPADGDAYIVGGSPTGAWSSAANKIARYSSVAAAWEFYTPKTNFWVSDLSTGNDYYYTGSAWAVWAQPDANMVHLSGTETISGAKTFSAAVTISNSTASTTTGTGCLILSGGLGVAGQINCASINTQSGNFGIKSSSNPAANFTDTTASKTWGVYYQNSVSKFWIASEQGVADWVSVTNGTGLLTAGGGVSVATGKTYQVNGTQVVAARKTGWTPWTGTATRTSFATGSATLQNVAEALKALIDDLHGTAGHGLIGT